jgi:peptide/nickel transport system substrate-binding protein
MLRLAGLGAGLALALAAAGCGGGGGGSTPAAAPAGGAAGQDGTLTVGLNVGADTLDPQTAISVPSYQVAANLFETLLTIAPDGAIKPSLATSYRYEPARKRIEFTLDPRATFSDGRSVTAADVAFSVGVWQKGEIYGSYYTSIKGVRTPDAHHVTLLLKSPNAGLLGVLAIGPASIYPKDYNGMSEKQFFRKPIGSGPFAVTSADLKREIDLTRNTHFRVPGQPHYDKVVMKVVPDFGQQLVQFQSGGLDIVNGIGADTSAQYPKDGLKSALDFSQEILITNVKDKAVSSPLLRRAVSKALDRAALIKGPLNGQAVLPTAVEPQAVPGVQPCSWCDWSTRDVAGAKALAAKAGYHGEPITLLVSAAGGPESLVAQAMQPMLAEAGITIKIATVDYTTLEDRMVKGDFQILLLNNTALGATPLDPLGFLATTANYYSGDDVTAAKKAVELINASRSEADLRTASAGYEKWAYSSASLIPVVALKGIYAVQRTIAGFQPPLSPGYSLAAVGKAGG